MAIFSTIKPLFPPFPWAGSGFAPCAVGWDGVRLHWSVSGNVGFGGWPRGPGGLADDQREWQQSAMQLSLGYGMSVCQSAAWQEASDEQGERDYLRRQSQQSIFGFRFSLAAVSPSAAVIVYPFPAAAAAAYAFLPATATATTTTLCPHTRSSILSLPWHTSGLG